MNYVTYYHHYGENKIQKLHLEEIESAIKSCNAKVKRGNIPRIRKDIVDNLMLKGWPPEVVIDSTSKISVTSMKERIGLCIQTGNMGRMYADLLKLQTLYHRKSIDVGLFIVASKNAAKELGDNIVNCDRLITELKIFEETITIPIIVLGIE